MEDCDIQLFETVVTDDDSEKVSFGKLILEELRCFRREMIEEVKQLNVNIQNTLFSKADIVNAILSNCPLSKVFDDNASPLHESSSMHVGKKDCHIHENFDTDIHNSQRENLTNSLDSLEDLVADDSCDPALNYDYVSKDTVEKHGKPQNLKECFKMKKIAKPVEVQVFQCNGDVDNTVRVSSSLSQGAASLSRKSSSFVNRSDMSDGNALVFNSDVSFSEMRKFVPLTNSSKDRILSKSSSFKVINTAKYSKQKTDPLSTLLTQPSKSKMIGSYKDFIKFNKLKSRKFDSRGFMDVKYLSRMKHKCTYCNKAFLSNNDLQRHIRIHTGDRPFRCNSCTKAYTRNDHLKRHMKQKHLAEYESMFPQSDATELSSFDKDKADPESAIKSQYLNS